MLFPVSGVGQLSNAKASARCVCSLIFAGHPLPPEERGGCPVLPLLRRWQYSALCHANCCQSVRGAI
ncbi:hypothetical protein D9J58_21320 [Escherichia coli]|nr:hypothetical protein [Escherichia coli]EEW2220590.1 hypothetical protein [Escherichia coli]EFO1313875.1 hypothetical protein [Escherichia coli]PJX03150.1 hypothetical protein CWI62_19135 [Escherichia coli]RYT03108.1 hypothetical protein EAJ19_23005 [Escherichia coli]